MWDIGVKNEWDTGYEGQKNREMGYQENRGMWDMGFIPMPKKIVPTFFYHIFFKNLSRMVYFSKICREPTFNRLGHNQDDF